MRGISISQKRWQLVLPAFMAFIWSAGSSAALGAGLQVAPKQRINVAAAAAGAKVMENRLWLSPSGREQDAQIVESLWIRFRGKCLIDLIRLPYLYEPGDWTRIFDPRGCPRNRWR